MPLMMSHSPQYSADALTCMQASGQSSGWLIVTHLYMIDSGTCSPSSADTSTLSLLYIQCS